MRRLLGVAVALLALAPAAAAQTVDPANPLRCDPIDPAACMLPFPNDFLTVADESTPTGRRIDFNAAAMPRNVANVPVDPTDYNRADGFSPGQLIVTKVPGLDTPEAFSETGSVPITDLARTYDGDAPIVVINARTKERHLIWTELDSNAASPEDVTLLIRPGVNFDEGERYIVALRNLKDAQGNTIEAQPAFKAIRDGEPTTDAAIEGRRAHLNEVIDTLGDAGIARDDLYLAWDFTIASAQSLAGRMLHIRDDAFAQLGDTNLADMEVQGTSPEFVVTKTEDFTPAENSRVRRRIEGRLLVPCYLDQPGCPPGSRFAHDPLTGMPVRIPGNTMAASVVCDIPHSATPENPSRVSPYGHGLLGEAADVDGVATKVGAEHNITFCGTDWSGMSFEDIGNVASILVEMGRFKTLADRAQQGMLNFLYLGRYLIHPDGASAAEAFQIDGKPVIDTERLFYYGGSQGGIMGGSLTAVAPDFDRGVLGVPGMNYSTLLSRSVDWGTGKGPDPTDPDIPEYSWATYEAYPDELERQLLFSIVQMLWDRAESNGYAHHMTDNPYPNTPPHEVLLSMAYGDHQVSNWTTMVMARTVGASLRAPVLDPGRSNEVTPFYGIPRIAEFPFSGSALTVWDVGPLRTVNGQTKGTTPPPAENVPNDQGVDPHGPDASETVNGRQQYSDFMHIDGKVVDTCGTAPCYLDGWTGP